MWSHSEHRCIATAYFLVILVVSSVQAGFVEVEDFDSYSPGEITDQSPWTGSSEMGSVVVDPSNATNNVLAVETDSGVLRRPMTVPDDEAHMIFFRFRIESQPKYSFGLSPYHSPSEYSDFGPEMSVANRSAMDTSDLRVHDGTYQDVLALEPNTWHNAWAMVNTATNEFQMWVNDTPGGSADAVTDRLYHDDDGDFEFRTGGAADMVSFYIKASGGNSEDGPFYLDDIYLDVDNSTLNLTNPVPEPSTLTLLGLGGLLVFAVMRKKAG